MAVTQDKPVPYAPPTAILEIVSRRRHRGLPTPINADVLGRASISASLIPRTLQALQTLDLIDEGGNPTPTFEAIRKAPEADYRRSLEDWLKGAYAEVFAFVDPTTDDEVRIRDAFRSYNPAGQQERMVTLFQGLCAAAGLAPEKSISAPRTQRSPPTPAQRHAINKVARVLNNNAKKSAASSGLPPALTGLLDSLPNAADGWTKSDRDRFYSTFGTVLDFCIPIRKAVETKENADQG